MSNYHRKLFGQDRCVCGSGMIFLYGRFHCLEQMQKELKDTDYGLFKKEK